MSILKQLSQANADERKEKWARYRQLICEVELSADELVELRSIMKALSKSVEDAANDSRVISQVAILRASVADKTCIERSAKSIAKLEEVANRRQVEIAAAHEKYRVAKIEQLEAADAVSSRCRDAQELRRLTMENPELFAVE